MYVRVCCKAAAIAAVAGVLTACAAEPGELGEPVPTVRVESAPDEEPGCVVVVEEPEATVSAEEDALFALTARRTVYLNRHGGTYTPGRNDSSRNVSSIVRTTSSIDAYEGSDSDWTTLVGCVRDQFAAYDIEVTDRDPGDATHIEAVVGGSPEQAGQGSGVGGVAPLYGDCSVVERAVVYVFSRNVYGVRKECEVVAHEVGHSLGLDHEFHCPDPMTYLNGCGDKHFQDVDAQCGEYSARSCRCGPTQNTHRHLISTLGPASSDPPPTEPPPGGGTDPGTDPPADAEPPVVAVAEPTDGSVLAGNEQIVIAATIHDDVAVSRAELVWHYRGTVTVDCASPPSGVTCEQSGDRYAWRFRVGTGARSFEVRATDTAGNVTTSPTVTVDFRAETAPPPATEPLEVAFESPADGTAIRPGEVLSIRASALGTSRITHVWLDWESAGGLARFALSPMGGDRWGVDLRLSSSAPTGGTRTLRIHARDETGATVTSGDHVIDVVP